MEDSLYLRKVTLILFTGEKGIDLSDFRIKFDVQATDLESPNHASIRVYNLAPSLIESLAIKGEYNEVTLQAGYLSNFGLIFQGTIRQFRVGRENAKDTYLDILAADWDIGYNQGFVNTSLNKPTPAQVVKESVKAMADEVNKQLNTNQSVDQVLNMKDFTDELHVPSLRGKVMFGMAKAAMRNVVGKLDASWSIQNGVVQVLPMRGYAEGSVLQLNRETGLLGLPEQTGGGIIIRCLLNPKIRIGGLVQLDNGVINKLYQATDAPVAFDQYTGFSYNTKLSPTGHYRVFAVDYEGDTRGRDWESTLTCLAVDMTQTDPNQAVIPKN